MDKESVSILVPQAPSKDKKLLLYNLIQKLS
jgi:hypothetical protein